MHSVTYAKALNVATSSGPQNCRWINLHGETKSWLNVGKYSRRVVATVTTEQPLIISVQDGVWNMSFRGTWESIARNDYAIIRVAAGDETSGWADRRSDRGIVVL